MNSKSILNYLEMIANSNLMVNTFMHAVALAAIFALFLISNNILKRVVFQTSVSILFLSVTINALVYGNPFHVITFGILALITLVNLFMYKRDLQITNRKWNIIISCFFIFMGFWYPEFVNKNGIELLIASPLGVIPCPTMLTTLGLLTLVSPSINRIQYTITLVFGLIYGIIGVFVFNVYLDITLLVLVFYSGMNYFYGMKRMTEIKKD